MGELRQAHQDLQLPRSSLVPASECCPFLPYYAKVASFGTWRIRDDYRLLSSHRDLVCSTGRAQLARRRYRTRVMRPPVLPARDGADPALALRRRCPADTAARRARANSSRAPSPRLSVPPGATLAERPLVASPWRGLRRDRATPFRGQPMSASRARAGMKIVATLSMEPPARPRLLRSRTLSRDPTCGRTHSNFGHPMNDKCRAGASSSPTESMKSSDACEARHRSSSTSFAAAPSRGPIRHWPLRPAGVAGACGCLELLHQRQPAAVRRSGGFGRPVDGGGAAGHAALRHRRQRPGGDHLQRRMLGLGHRVPVGQHPDRGRPRSARLAHRHPPHHGRGRRRLLLGQRHSGAVVGRLGHALDDGGHRGPCGIHLVRVLAETPSPAPSSSAWTISRSPSTTSPSLTGDGRAPRGRRHRARGYGPCAAPLSLRSGFGLATAPPPGSANLRQDRERSMNAVLADIPIRARLVPALHSRTRRHDPHCSRHRRRAHPKKRGPKTPEDKARSSMNALKHGLRARSFGVLPEERPGRVGGARPGPTPGATARSTPPRRSS